MAKIHGRPLLPWWVYALYFAFAITVAVWHNVAHGDEMKPATGKTAEKAKHGRKGDTRLAHVSPMEEAILKAMGGAGTTNPKTGYKEYYDEGGSGFDPGYGEGGYVDPGAPTADTAATGGLSYSQYASPQQLVDEDKTGPGAPSNPFGGPQGGNQAAGGFERAINSFLASRVPNPMISPSGYGLYKGAQALGEYVGKPLNDMFGGTATAEAPQFGSSNMGAGGANSDYFNQSLGIQPVAASMPAFMRPAEEPPPASFGMAGGMTDLQKRAQIATGGTQGNSGQFRTPEAMRFYGNLIARALIGDNNAVAQQSPNLLPVEDTYLKQVSGVTPQNNPASPLDALKPYWSR